ncbi:MAG: hypothetical protein ABJE95_20175 [Byssovorax sp.]
MGTNELFATPTFFAVLLSTLSTLAVFLVANGIAAWYDERTRRAGAVVRKGAQPRPGFGTFHGVAQNLDARSGGELVRREIEEECRQAPNGQVWRKLREATTGRAFLLVLESGAEIEVEGRDARLVGFPETTPGAYSDGPGQLPRREMITRVSAGDEVWATGVLAGSSIEGGGAYRSSVARPRLRAPRRDAIELSRESPVARWAALAMAHKVGAYSALGLLVMAHGLFFRAEDRLVFQPSTLSAAERFSLLQAAPERVSTASVLIVVGALALWIVKVSRARKQRPA